MAKVWEGTWEKVQPLGSGGQGSACLVRRRSNQDDLAVVKELNKPNDPERRGRMRREAVALQTLQHPGIPKYIECNTSEYSGTAPLYLVLEYIPGPTLEKRIGEGVMQLDEAVRLAVGLVDIIAYCHERDIGHRDIKPDNIILRDGDAADPVLIDYGQSFNQADDQPALTSDTQQMGNRFLGLPELLVPGASRRDLRSDLTFCCGILYYSITGIWPAVLRDETTKPPHEREPARRLLGQLPSERQRELLRVFGRGFRLGIEQRWHSADDLRTALARIITESPAIAQARVDPVLAAVAASRDEFERLSDELRGQVDDAADAFASAFEPVRMHLVDEVEKRRAKGIPIRLATEWNGNDTSLSSRELVRLAATEPGERAVGAFYADCFCGGSESFAIYIELTFEAAAAPHWIPVRIDVRMRHPKLSGGIDDTFYFEPEGHLNAARAGRVGDRALVDLILGWLDDPAYWRFPPKPRLRRDVW